ncbi:MAG: BMP family ABC transporter substrate-binding protein [Leucobacter sp.]
MSHNKRRLLATAAGIGAVLVLAGCSGQAAPDSQESGGGSTAEPINVGLFVANAFGDHSYFDAAAATVDELESEFGATVTTYEGKLDTQNYGPLLQDAADQNELVYVVGNEAIDAAGQAAAQNPETTFVFLNGFVPGGEVVSATFRNAEKCYPAGVLAALLNEEHGSTVAGFMGGLEVAPILDCEAGFEQGVAATDPDMEVASRIVGAFDQPAKGLETATALEQAGAHAVLAFAGLSGQGAIAAVDAGSDIAPIMSSMPEVPDSSPAVLNEETSVLMLDIASQFVDGSLEKGSAQSYGFAEGALTILYNDDLVSAEQQEQVESAIQQIKDGKIKPEGTARS